MWHLHVDVYCEFIVCKSVCASYSGKDTTLHQDLAIGNYIFKRVDNFKYLGTMVNNMNNRAVEVNARCSTENG
jgi:hypothetical protein